jgi:hypothetical protein
MRATLTASPREFEASGVRIRDFGKVELGPWEMVTVATASGRECDVTATPWGLYLAPSLNGRLEAQGLRVALVANGQGKLFLNAVEADRLEIFERYLKEQDGKVVRWLDGYAPPRDFPGLSPEGEPAP